MTTISVVQNVFVYRDINTSALFSGPFWTQIVNDTIYFAINDKTEHRRTLFICKKPEPKGEKILPDIILLENQQQYRYYSIRVLYKYRVAHTTGI